MRPFSVDMMVYASADTSCLFGLLVLICKNLVDQETGSAQSSLTKKHFAESSGDGNDLLISAIENGQANGENVMMNAEMEHHKSSSGCCPSFLSAYDDITSNDAVYSMRDDDDDFEEYKEVRSIRELYHSMRRKIKEFWYDLCDDIFLNFGDYMVSISIHIHERTLFSLNEAHSSSPLIRRIILTTRGQQEKMKPPIRRLG